MSGWWLSTRSADETRALGACLGALLEAGDCVALEGELGAGKTTFAAGLGAGLGIGEDLSSPTYVLCCEYTGRLPLLHLDAYFTERLGSQLDEGLAERFHEEALTVVEWADRVEEWLPEDRLRIRLEGLGESRRVGIEGLGPRSRVRAAALQQAWEGAHGARNWAGGTAPGGSA